MLEPNNDVHEEVVKPLLEKSKPDLEAGFSFRPLQIHHPKKKLESISIVSKLTLVIIDYLFHSYYAFHFKLMFYVLCKNI